MNVIVATSNENKFENKTETEKQGRSDKILVQLNHRQKTPVAMVLKQFENYGNKYFSMKWGMNTRHVTGTQYKGNHEHTNDRPIAFPDELL